MVDPFKERQQKGGRSFWLLDLRGWTSSYPLRSGLAAGRAVAHHQEQFKAFVPLKPGLAHWSMLPGSQTLYLRCVLGLSEDDEALQR